MAFKSKISQLESEVSDLQVTLENANHKIKEQEDCIKKLSELEELNNEMKKLLSNALVKLHMQQLEIENLNLEIYQLLFPKVNIKNYYLDSCLFGSFLQFNKAELPSQECQRTCISEKSFDLIEDMITCVDHTPPKAHSSPLQVCSYIIEIY